MYWLTVKDIFIPFLLVFNASLNASPTAPTLNNIAVYFCNLHLCLQLPTSFWHSFLWQLTSGDMSAPMTLSNHVSFKVYNFLVLNAAVSLHECSVSLNSLIQFLVSKYAPWVFNLNPRISLRSTTPYADRFIALTSNWDRTHLTSNCRSYHFVKTAILNQSINDVKWDLLKTQNCLSSKTFSWSILGLTEHSAKPLHYNWNNFKPVRFTIWSVICHCMSSQSWWNATADTFFYVSWAQSTIFITREKIPNHVLLKAFWSVSHHTIILMNFFSDHCELFSIL